MNKSTIRFVGVISVLIMFLLSMFSLYALVEANPFLEKGNFTVPTFVSYQGQIWQGDVPYDGTGYFKFAILDSEISPVWTNDGNFEPVTSVPLPVVDGIFNVNLGDTKISGMTQPLEPKIFEDPSSFLIVWFSPDNINWTEMPEQTIAAVPFALKAQDAAFSTSSGSAAYASEAGLAENSDLFDGLTSTAFQLRVTGSCPPGQAIKVINQNGSVECETIPASPVFTLTVLDENPDVGEFSSLAIGSDGMGIISYYDNTNDNLKVAHCENINCTNATITAYTSKWNIGKYNSIAIGSDNLPIISYYELDNQDLYIAHCDNVACTSATMKLLDSAGNVGEYTSIVMALDGNPLVSYYDQTNGDLRLYHCDDSTCTDGSYKTIDSVGDVGQWTDLVIGSDEFPLISYYDVGNSNLKVAHCEDAGCTSITTTTLDSDVNPTGQYSSITIGSDNKGLISYHAVSSELRVAHCNNLACSDKTLSTVDDGTETSPAGRHTSIAIGIDGLGLISYSPHGYTEVKVAHCDNVRCTHTHNNTIASKGYLGSNTSIAIGEDGMGLIVFSGYSPDYFLYTVHCSNELCIPINWEH